MRVLPSFYGWWWWGLIPRGPEYMGGGKAVKVSSSHVRPVNPTGISRTKPSYVRLDAHGYDTRDVILFEDIPGGMSENLNGEEFIVLNNSGVNQFSYGYLNGTEVDARSFQPFVEDSGTGRVGKLNRLVRNRTARILNITNNGNVTVEYPHDFEKGDIIVIGGVESGSVDGGSLIANPIVANVTFEESLLDKVMLKP